MKKYWVGLILLLITNHLFAGNGDSIFNRAIIHQLHITFPYPAFYDSLINTNVTDQYLNVSIDFNGELFNNVGIKVKGNSSFNNPSQKKSFKLDFNEFVAGQDIHGLKKLNFNNSFKDPSFMREKLVNDFLIKHQLPAPRTTYCNVYMNGQLWGLYTILEEVDDEFCKHWFGSNDGNLFKGDPHGDLRWKGSATQSLYETEYELKNNATANNWSDLIHLIDVINNTTLTNLQAALDATFNTSNFVKQWATLNLFSSMDSYIGSGHNYYIYHDTITDKFQWIAWDNNETFGSFKNSLTSNQLLNMDMFYVATPNNRPLCKNMLSNSYYKNLYQNAYCELKQDVTNAYFNPKIDSIQNVIQSSVYADPKKFYTNNQFDSSINFNITLSGPGGITVFGLKNFISDRALAVNASLATNAVTCWPNAIPETLLSNNSVDIFPNPANESLTISATKLFHTVKLFDITGRLIYFNNNLSTKSHTIAMIAYQPGIYWLQVDQEKAHQILK